MEDVQRRIPRKLRDDVLHVIVVTSSALRGGHLPAAHREDAEFVVSQLRLLDAKEREARELGFPHGYGVALTLYHVNKRMSWWSSISHRQVDFRRYIRPFARELKGQ